MNIKDNALKGKRFFLLSVFVVYGFCLLLLLNSCGSKKSDSEKSELTTYTLADIDNGKLGDQVVINRIKDIENIDEYIAEYNKTHPKQKITTWVGDETQFLNVKEKNTSNSKTDDTWKSAEPNGEEPQIVEPGKTYRVRIFVHNDNPNGTNAMAKDLRAWVNMSDETAEKTKIITVYLGGNNTGEKNFDESKFESKDGTPFNLAYVPGSVKYFNSWTSAQNREDFMDGDHGGYAPLSDYIFASSGVKLGYDKYSSDEKQFDGQLPGCYQYSGWIYFDIIPQFVGS
jgi:hypothetical protein